MEQIWRWNSSCPPAVEECVHTLIYRKAIKTPEATAVHASDAVLTYREVDQLSTRLAHHLVSCGVGPEVIVPLCFEKSAWTVVAMVAVIKAGGALLFVDPQHPVARTKTVLAKVDAKMIICSRMYSGLVTSFGTNLATVVVSKDSIEKLPRQTTLPTTTVRPDNILYVIFTSGSTGTPKGCVIEHRSFLSGAMKQAAASSMKPTSRVCQLAAYTFDVSILEQLTALTVGACVCVPGEEARAKGPTFIMNDFNINWCFLTPSLAKMIKPSDVPHLEVLILGGEALSREDVETWASHVQLANGYGPSECSIAATANSRLSFTTDPSNIGYALGGVCWITDANDPNTLVPIGGQYFSLVCNGQTC
jgi:non-ribosomal peptide synthetase component F